MKRSEALEKLAREQRLAGHAANTRCTYAGRVADYIDGLTAGKFTDFQGYLDHLADVRKVTPATVKGALNALVFFHKRVLDRDPGTLRIPKCHRSRRVPVFLTHPECVDIRTLQDQLGHTHVQTTEIYTHAIGAKGTASPLDRLSSNNPIATILPFPRTA